MSTPERKGLLKDDSPMTAPSTSTRSPAQQFTTRHRPGYARVPSVSVSFNEESLARDITDTPGEDETAPASSHEGVGRSHGLGIALPSGTNSRSPRVSSPLSNDFSTPNQRSGTDERRPMASPPSTGGLSGSTRADTSFGDFDTAYRGAKHKDSRISLQSTLPPSLYARSDAGLLSVKSRYEDFEPHHNCQSARAVKHRRLGNCVSVTILTLAIFSTAFSGIFLGIALYGPFYGRRIRAEGGSFTPASAAFLTSLFARLIELSFVTVIVSFIGQALARRAFKLETIRGITLAELSMRTWVMQPGTLFTQWESVRYAGITFLGATSLLAALFALLYTTAATALVQPQLRFPDWQHQVMQGIVKMSFANSVEVKNECVLPNNLIYKDDTNASLTCLQIEHASAAYHNYFSWLQTWTTVLGIGNSSIDLGDRPPGYALYADNTTIVAPWIERQNVTAVNSTRWINNVTMAMPHVGVIQAAQDTVNQIVQPSEVEGAIYNIRASVPSPMLNVLCVTMTNADLKPFVYDLWENKSKEFNSNDTNWNDHLVYTDEFAYPYLNSTEYPNGTQFDDTFGWGLAYGKNNVPPVFPRLPKDYNIILNGTDGMPWGRTSIYVLGKGGPTDSLGNAMEDSDGNAFNYAMCQLQVGLTMNCSTSYNASSSGGALEAHCEDENDQMRYILHAGEEDLKLQGRATFSKEWPNIGGEWARSLSYNDGMRDGDSANARTLTQLILTSANLSYGLPSLAEAIAVQAGDTLIQSIKDSPFVGRAWNYTLPNIDSQPQWFNATIRSQQYASGGVQPYEKAFFVVLFGVCIMNVMILVYFLWHKDWYSDFSEPTSLFALAVNSPPSAGLSGSCGCGPAGEQFALNWKLNNDDGHYYMEPQEGEGRGQENMVNVESPRLSRRRWTETFEMMGSPGIAVKKRFSRS